MLKSRYNLFYNFYFLISNLITTYNIQVSGDSQAARTRLVVVFKYFCSFFNIVKNTCLSVIKIHVKNFLRKTQVPFANSSFTN